ncbi:hypothetical protein SAM40697_3898 [Streptomyces ambofaciens]|uniref:Integral membrane protein n=1 Tax=Streptomyces ambofaciens TaxID=1889 RepID=A0ABM6B273_STRAM|nr:hypothetical protein [Streptomyces ambofaciens]ANB07856.1 hypothetical protein SAM40697_3898 [Streptomyces ambofaciens]
MTTAPTATGGAAPPTRTPGRRWWPGTLWVLVGTPLALAGCGWLGQDAGLLSTLLGVVVALLVLATAWILCGAKAGAGVAVLGFAFLLFVGPALGDHAMKERGVRHDDAVITEVSTYRGKGGERRPVCTVALTDTERGRTVEVGDTGGCEPDFTPGTHVTLVDDPEGHLAPRLSDKAEGVAPYLLWTLAGLLTALETCALYGRLRRRRRHGQVTSLLRRASEPFPSSG